MAICAGKQELKELSQYRDYRCKSSKETIEKSLCGYYREEIMFNLKQGLESYDHYQTQLQLCNEEIERLTRKFDDKSKGEKIELKKEGKKNNLEFNAQRHFSG